MLFFGGRPGKRTQGGGRFKPPSALTQEQAGCRTAVSVCMDAQQSRSARAPGIRFFGGGDAVFGTAWRPGFGK